MSFPIRRINSCILTFSFGGFEPIFSLLVRNRLMALEQLVRCPMFRRSVIHGPVTDGLCFYQPGDRLFFQLVYLPPLACLHFSWLILSRLRIGMFVWYIFLAFDFLLIRSAGTAEGTWFYGRDCRTTPALVLWKRCRWVLR